MASLDTAAADAVLDQLTEDQAQRVRQIVVEMDDINESEQRRVIDDFFGIGSSRPQENSSGVELDGRLAMLGTRSSFEMERESGIRPADSRPFEFLEEAEADKLARLLGPERPQTIALVLSHLPPARACQVLTRLGSSVQNEVIHRLVDLEETDPEILREVEEALRARLSQPIEMQRRRMAGLQAVVDILEAADGRTGMQILDNLAAHDRKLAERLGPRPLRFDDLPDLSDELLDEVFETAGREWMIPALIGAPPALVDRVLAFRPPIQAQAIRKELNHPGPIRLSDVEEARREIARIAQRIVYQVQKRAAGVAKPQARKAA